MREKNNITSNLYLKSRDFLLDDGLKMVKILSVDILSYEKQEYDKVTDKYKNVEKNYFIYEITYTSSTFKIPRKYKISCEKLDKYISIRMQKIKKLFEDDPDFTF